jgi:hypothetical protein
MGGNGFRRVTGASRLLGSTREEQIIWLGAPGPNQGAAAGLGAFATASRTTADWLPTP